MAAEGKSDGRGEGKRGGVSEKQIHAIRQRWIRSHSTKGLVDILMDLKQEFEGRGVTLEVKMLFPEGHRAWEGGLTPPIIDPPSLPV